MRLARDSILGSRMGDKELRRLLRGVGCYRFAQGLSDRDPYNLPGHYTVESLQDLVNKRTQSFDRIVGSSQYNNAKLERVKVLLIAHIAIDRNKHFYDWFH
jgi:hypothetical protein